MNGLLLSALDLAPALLESLIKISLILLIAIGALTLLRRQSAATRHWLLAAAVACALALPALTLVVPSWHVAVAGASTSPLMARLLGLPEPGETGSVQVDATVMTGDTDTAFAQDAAGAGRSNRAQNDPLARARRAGAAISLTTTERIAAVLVLLWLAGVALNLTVLIAGLARLRWLAARARPLSLRDQPWAHLAATLAREQGVRRSVRLLPTDHPTLLVTWGCLRPRILLPAAARGWTPQRMRVVLAHEIAHIARGDWAAQMAAELLRAVAWPTPLAWIACRRLRAESELACDDAVLSRGVEAPEYAEQLVALARALNQRRERWSPALGIVRLSAFEWRIRAMLNARLNRTPLTTGRRAAIALAFAAVTLPLAGIAVRAQSASAGLDAIVRDPRGTPLQGVEVTQTAGATQKAQTATTDNAGRIALSALPAGAYRVDIKQMGFKPFEEQVALADGKRVQRDFRLTLGRVQETVLVTGAGTGSPRVNPDKPLSAPPVQKDKPLSPPLKLQNVSPVYPKSAHDAGVQGTVGLQATIATDGSVSHVKVVKSAHPDLDKAAMDAVRLWRYAPTTLNGVAVGTEMLVTISFKP